MKIAVFGSRQGVDLERVGRYLSDRWDSRIVVVSGGAEGVDRYAEQTWAALGGRVISFRVRQISPEEYGVQRVTFGGGQPTAVDWLTDEPTFETYDGALIYRDMLIAELADRGVGFRAGGFYSRGTTHTADFFRAAEKPCSLHEEE